MGREGEKEEDRVETRSQTLHLSPLCWRPSATKGTADEGKACQTPLYHTHTHTHTHTPSLSLTHTLSGRSVWVNSPPFDIPAVREIRGCRLTWSVAVWQQRTVGEQRGCSQCWFSCSRNQRRLNLPSCLQNLRVRRWRNDKASLT